MAKFYEQDRIFIWAGRTLYGVGYSQAQGQFYATKNFTLPEGHKPITKRGEIKAMTREEAQAIE